MDVLTAVITAQGEIEMTTSLTGEQAASTIDGQGPKPDAKANTAPRKPRGAPAKGKSSKKTTSAKKAPKPLKNAKTPKAAGARAGSKADTVLTLIQRAKGATLAEIMEATGWQAHSVRGFLSGTLGRKRGLKVESAKNENGEHRYSLSQ
jgi:hypothetical protein